MASLGRRSRWSLSDVRWRGGVGDCVCVAIVLRAFAERSVGSPRCGRALGNDVHSLSQSVPDGNESAFVRDVFYFWRIGDDGSTGDWVQRARTTLARTPAGACGGFLADAWWVRVGDWRSVPAVCCKVRGHKPRHSAFEYESALGIAVGDFCFWGVAGQGRDDVLARDWRIAADDDWRGGYCAFFRDGRRTEELEDRKS